MIATQAPLRLETTFRQWFEENRPTLASGQARIDHLREEAIEIVEQLGFPGRKHEAWKYTDPLKALNDIRSFAVLPETGLSAASATPYHVPGLDAHLLVFLNGTFQADASSVGEVPDGIVVTTLAEAASSYPELLDQYFGTQGRLDSDVFLALNTAFARDGAFVFVPEHTVLDKPVHVLHLTSSDEPTATFLRNLYVAQNGSRLQIVESFHTLSGSHHLSLPVSELITGEEADVEQVRIQDEGVDASQISGTLGYQHGNSRFSSITATFSGRLVRNNVHLNPDGEFCETNMGGLFALDGRQHVDNHTFVDHTRPHCNSNELFKGILDDSATAAFSGMLLVRRAAQKTNAFQENKTILLTDDAASYAKPQLEIYADDVRCSHGATTGALDPEALFYLRARGIGEIPARNMLLFAFVSDVAEMIGIDPVRDYLIDRLHELLD